MKVVEQIASSPHNKCIVFAHKLLRDSSVVKKVEMSTKNKEELVPLVLYEWLDARNDDQTCKAAPRTWEALAQCVEQAGMDKGLVKHIRDNQPQRELQAVLSMSSAVCSQRFCQF